MYLYYWTGLPGHNIVTNKLRNDKKFYINITNIKYCSRHDNKTCKITKYKNKQ